MGAATITGTGLDDEIRAVGRRLAERPQGWERLRRVPEDRLTALLSRDPRLRAALFQVVDVAPACAGPREIAAHLAAYLDDSGRDDLLVALAASVARGRVTRAATGSAASIAVDRMARRFIAGSSPQEATGELARLWRGGTATSVDLLGEATVTRAEGEAYARRCADALDVLARAAGDWPARPALERDAAGPVPRVNLSVKVTALTPLVRRAAPARARDDAARHLRDLLRHADRLGAHLHVDAESLDSREAVVDLALSVLDEREFRDGPSAGLVIQAYLRDADEIAGRVLDWSATTSRTVPLTVRLVKGAYWDHETIDARQHGWPVPVWTEKQETDRCFERLTRRLVGAFPRVRPAIASHNLRSVAHAVVTARRAGLGPHDLEVQVLRGLGDDLQGALAREGLRGRTYCPVGDLVAGMAYLVRRLLENTSNDSFLSAQASGADLDDLLRPP